MKKLLLIALALVAFQSKAQQQKRGHFMAQLSAEDISIIQTKRMTLHLDLNNDQQREIQKMNLENAKARKIQIAEREARKENKTNEKLSTEDRVKRINKILDRKIETKAKMKKILNGRQYAKWEKAQIKKHQKRKL